MICLIYIGYYNHTFILNWLRVFWDRDALLTYLQGFGIWGPVVISLLILIQLFIAMLPGQVLVAVSGYIYGAPLTILFVATSGIFGSQLVFLLTRKYGRPLIYKFASEKVIEKWNIIAGGRGALFYFLMFVLPFVPSDIMCYVAGSGKISSKDFFVANFMGRLWSTTEIAIMGAYGFQPPLVFWVLFVLSLTGLYAGWLIYNKAVPPAL